MSYIFKANVNKFKVGVLIAFLITGIVTALFLIPAIAGADTDVTPPENTAQIVSVDHVISPVTTNVESTTHEVTPLTFPAEQLTGTSDLTWLYTGVVIGLILITIIGLVIFLRRKRRHVLTPLLIFLLGLAILTAIPTTAFAQTLNITTWACPTSSPQISTDSIDAAGRVWFIDNTSPDTIGYLNPATNEFNMWLLPLEGTYRQLAVDGIGGVWFFVRDCLGMGDSRRGLGRLDISTNLFTYWPRGQTSEITADVFGNAWRTDASHNLIECLNPMTNMVTSYLTNDPFGISADSSGNIWIAKRGDASIGRLNPSTGVITEWPLPNSSSTPTQIHVVSQQVYFSDYYLALIGHLNSVTNEMTIWSVVPTGRVPFYISADALGNIWFGLGWISGGIANLAPDNILRWWNINEIWCGPAVDVDGGVFIAGRITGTDPIRIHKLQR